MQETIKKPVGELIAIWHRPGGEFDFNTQKFVGAEVVDIKNFKNMIVNLASVYMAQRMVPGTSWGNGINYLAVGTGYGTGSPASPQPEDATYIKLRNEVERISCGTNWAYLDAGGASVGQSTPTNVVQYVFTFGITQANAGLVEMGLFGGDAVATKDSGKMFNYKVMPVWNKTADIELTIAWKITF